MLRPWFETGSDRVGFVVNKTTRGHVCLLFFFYSSINIITEIKTRQARCTERVARMECTGIQGLEHLDERDNLLDPDSEGVILPLQSIAITVCAAY
jgi:hypothetical protein